MNPMMRILKIFLKIILIITGSMLLLGGGFCMLTNVYFISPLTIFLVPVMALIAWLGWLLLKWAGVWRYFATRNNATPTPGRSRNNGVGQ